MNEGNPPWFVQTLSWRWDTSCKESYRQAFFTHFVGVTLCWGELTTHDWWMILLDYFWHEKKFEGTILIHYILKRCFGRKYYIVVLWKLRLFHFIINDWKKKIRSILNSDWPHNRHIVILTKQYISISKYAIADQIKLF